MYSACMPNFSSLNVQGMNRQERIAKAIAASGKQKQQIATECGVSNASAYQAIFTMPKYFLKHGLTEGLGLLKFTPTPPETTARPKGLALYTTQNPRGVIPAKPVQRE